jgi:serine/threonine protein kinase
VEQIKQRISQREAQMASSLNHPPIVTVYDVGEVDGRQHLVTEFVDGGTLKDWAKKGSPLGAGSWRCFPAWATGWRAAHGGILPHS